MLYLTAVYGHFNCYALNDNVVLLFVLTCGNV